jgi:glycine dehydrogenase
MNALVGVAAPGEFGGDVSHLNLHKTVLHPARRAAGPGVGPVCVVADLVPYLPGHAAGGVAGARRRRGVAAPLGNAAVLPISWMYMRMMGADGCSAPRRRRSSRPTTSRPRLSQHYELHYSGNVPGLQGGGVAHECILDLRPLKDATGGAQGVTAEDVAKRLIDYGFHAPTLSFPVPGTLMVEPTESESLAELDRFCAAMIAIREEIGQVERGVWPRDDNPLHNAPHTAEALLRADWPHAYSREQAAYPLSSLRRSKYWAAGRPRRQTSGATATSPARARRCRPTRIEGERPAAAAGGYSFAAGMKVPAPPLASGGAGAGSAASLGLRSRTRYE